MRLVANRLIQAEFLINPSFWTAYLFIDLIDRILYPFFKRNTQNGIIVKFAHVSLIGSEPEVDCSPKPNREIQGDVEPTWHLRTCDAKASTQFVQASK